MSKERYFAEALLGFVVALLATHLFNKQSADWNTIVRGEQALAFF